MVTVRIFEIRQNKYKVVRKAVVDESLLSAITTYIYTIGGVQKKYVEPAEYTFQVKAPLLNTLVVKDLEKMLEIKFVEEKPEG